MNTENSNTCTNETVSSSHVREQLNVEEILLEKLQAKIIALFSNLDVVLIDRPPQDISQGQMEQEKLDVPCSPMASELKGYNCALQESISSLENILYQIDV